MNINCQFGNLNNRSKFIHVIKQYKITELLSGYLTNVNKIYSIVFSVSLYGKNLENNNRLYIYICIYIWLIL